MTYKEALAYPAKHEGWAHVGKDSPSMWAVAAQALGRTYCIRPEAIYNWAVKHTVNLQEQLSTFIDNSDLLLVCVLNDWTVACGQSELLAADKAKNS